MNEKEVHKLIIGYEVLQDLHGNRQYVDHMTFWPFLLVFGLSMIQIGGYAAMHNLITDLENDTYTKFSVP